MQRSLWTGSLSFSLITIPVSLYSASKERTFDFNMLRKNDLCPISFKRVCRNTGEEVPYDQIVKGYEYKEGDYVVLDPEDFKRAVPKESDNIDIKIFADEKDIEAKHYRKPYYMLPLKGASKAYVLLREALEQTGKVAIGRMIFRDKENLVAVKPEGDFLILIDLRFEDEIRDPKELEAPTGADVSKEEVKLALDLIDKMSGKFNPKDYPDTYAEKLEKIITAKAKGKKLKPLPKAPRATKTEDLVAQLRASLTQ